MSRRIAVTTSSFGVHDDSVLSPLEQQGYEIVLNSTGRKLKLEETLEVCAGCIGILAGTEDYDRTVLEDLPDLRVISRVGSGMDNVDLSAAKDLGISVVNTPYGPTAAVAELTVGLILDMLRNISLMDRELRGGIWKKRMGNLLREKRVGIVGLGRIGGMLAGLLEGLGAQVAYSDVCATSQGSRYERMDLDDLLRWADIVSLHCPSCANGALIGEREIGLIGVGGFLVNVSRGDLVDETVLYDTLRDGRLAGAATDVFSDEPYGGSLRDLDNVVLTPHVGSYALEGRVAMERDAVANLLAGLEDA